VEGALELFSAGAKNLKLRHCIHSTAVAATLQAVDAAVDAIES